MNRFHHECREEHEDYQLNIFVLFVSFVVNILLMKTFMFLYTLKHEHKTQIYINLP